jgi:hypothetical protein
MQNCKRINESIDSMVCNLYSILQVLLHKPGFSKNLLGYYRGIHYNCISFYPPF